MFAAAIALNSSSAPGGRDDWGRRTQSTAPPLPVSGVDKVSQSRISVSSVNSTERC